MPCILLRTKNRFLYNIRKLLAISKLIENQTVMTLGILTFMTVFGSQIVDITLLTFNVLVSVQGSSYDRFT